MNKFLTTIYLAIVAALMATQAQALSSARYGESGLSPFQFTDQCEFGCYVYEVCGTQE